MTPPFEANGTVLLIAAAKARIWAEEGWDVSVTDGEGKKLDRAELDGLFAA